MLSCEGMSRAASVMAQWAMSGHVGPIYTIRLIRLLQYPPAVPLAHWVLNWLTMPARTTCSAAAELDQSRPFCVPSPEGLRGGLCRARAKLSAEAGRAATSRLGSNMFIMLAILGVTPATGLTVASTSCEPSAWGGLVGADLHIL